MSISKISPLRVSSPAEILKTGTTSATDMMSNVGQTFGQILSNLETTQKSSDNLLQQLASGENVDIAQLMIATEQTDISMRVTMGIRDRLVEAYKEVMRMSV